MQLLPERLAKARVHIGGVGRIGTSIALALHGAGVGHITCNDPQSLEEEQLSGCVFSRRSDLGRPKVHVLERFFDGRPGFVFEPLVAPNESPSTLPYLEQADLIISSANRLEARLHLERTALRLQKPCLQASVQDGRRALGGMITIWVPGGDACCFGCLFHNQKTRFRRGEILFPTVTRIIANLAAHLALEMLEGEPRELAQRYNVITVDMGAFSIEKLSVKRRAGCGVCGRAA